MNNDVTRAATASTMQVWKYAIPLEDEFTLEIPPCDLLYVREQGEQGCLWVRVYNPDAPAEPRRFVLRGTGHSGAIGKYVGTFFLQEGRFVFHLFEVGR